MVAMNLIYALSAYPFGKLSDRVSHAGLLALGLVVLIAADLVLATDDRWLVVLAGVALWGVHMGITQGLLATMVADTAPAELRGTAFGFFNLMSGIAMLVASDARRAPLGSAGGAVHVPRRGGLLRDRARRIGVAARRSSRTRLTPGRTATSPWSFRRSAPRRPRRRPS